ncbi:MAG: hypothetical protein NT108_02315 [Candidatus Kaiserbacteria bacterium]|nr:hypothetical protein [Candidatus Kaiserbacteria bacterium]
MNVLIAIVVVLVSLLPVSSHAAINRPPRDPSPITIPSFDAIPVDRELLGDVFRRLREYTLTNSEQSTIGPNAARLLGLEITGLSIPTKNVSSSLPDGECYFIVSLKPDTDDIVILEMREGAPFIMYLTNSKGELRAGLVNHPSHSYLITNEQAAAGFRALLEFWTDAAKTLPSNESFPK